MNDGKLWNISLKSSQIIPQYKKQLLKKKQIRIKKEKLDTLKSVILMKYITHKKKLEKELDEIYDK